jgi:hypothetical protein
VSVELVVPLVTARAIAAAADDHNPLHRGSVGHRRPNVGGSLLATLVLAEVLDYTPAPALELSMRYRRWLYVDEPFRVARDGARLQVVSASGVVASGRLGAGPTRA